MMGTIEERERERKRERRQLFQAEYYKDAHGNLKKISGESFHLICDLNLHRVPV